MIVTEGETDPDEARSDSLRERRITAAARFGKRALVTLHELLCDEPHLFAVYYIDRELADHQPLFMCTLRAETREIAKIDITAWFAARGLEDIPIALDLEHAPALSPCA